MAYGRADRYLESFARDLNPRCTPYRDCYFCSASAKQTIVAALGVRVASGDGD